MNKTNNIPAMTPTEVHQFLESLGKSWSRQGVAMELGCWLGATSVPLLRGLVQVGYDKPFWAFDRWVVNPEQVAYAKKQGVSLKNKQDSSVIYTNNVDEVYNDVQIIKGNMPDSLKWFDPEPIEIMIFDAPKKNPVFQKCMDFLLPHCIPGVTTIGLLDYHFWKYREGKVKEELKAPVKYIEAHPNNFEMIKDWSNCSCAFFKYVKQV
jgi:hypothetical protein